MLCLVLLIAFRIYLPTLVLNYTNDKLSNLSEYSGSVRDIDICVFKGQYTINDLTIYKRDRKNAPLIEVPKTALSVQWSALKQLRLVGEIDTYSAVVNFIIYDGEAEDQNSQTGIEIDWTKSIRDLMPLQVNRFTVNQATIHYKDPAQEPPIDIYLNDLNIIGSNFTNATNLENPLPSKIIAECSSVGDGQMYMTMRINPLMQTPDLDYTFKFEGVDLTALNDFSLAYSGLDFDKGTLDLYSEMVIKNKSIKGYVKPVMNNVDFIDLSEDINTPLRLIWEGLASLVVEIFENQRKDQFATKVPIVGHVDAAETKIWPTIGAVLRNAFVQAFTKEPDETIDYEEFNLD